MQQILAALGGSTNPMLPNPLSTHPPGHTPPTVPPTPSQVQATIALLAASTQGNGMSGSGFPSSADIRRTEAPLATPDSSSSDVSAPNSAAALAAFIAASAS